MVPLVPPSSQGSPPRQPRQPWSGQPAQRRTAAAAGGLEAKAKPTSLGIAQKENQLAELSPETPQRAAGARAGAGAVDADAMGGAYPSEPVWRL